VFLLASYATLPILPQQLLVRWIPFAASHLARVLAAHNHHKAMWFKRQRLFRFIFTNAVGKFWPKYYKYRVPTYDQYQKTLQEETLVDQRRKIHRDLQDRKNLLKFLWDLRGK